MSLDYSAPQFAVRIVSGDYPATQELLADVTPLVREVSFEESTEMADMIELRVDNAFLPPKYPGATPFRVMDSELFQPGNQIELWGGYPETIAGVPAGTSLEPLGRGDIVGWSPEFPENGEQILVVRAYDRSHKMMMNQDSRFPYIAVSDHAVVASVVSEYSVLPKFVEPTLPPEDITSGRVKHKGQTDWDFIRQLGTIHGFRTRVFWDFDISQWVLEWRQPAYILEPLPSLLMHYGPPSFSLRSFFPEISLAGTITDFELTGYMTEIGQKISFKNKVFTPDPKLKQKTSGSEVTGEWKSASELYFTVFGQSFEIKTKRRFIDQRAMEEYARVLFQQTQDRWITGTGMMFGEPRISVDKMVSLSGLGERLDGDWRIFRALHKFSADAGYITEFGAHKLDKSRPTLVLDIF